MAEDDDLEGRIRGALEAGQTTEAVELALDEYGDGCFAYLVSRTGDPVRAADAYQEFCIDLFRGLRGFRWESSLQTWCFTLARSAHARSVRGAKNRPDVRLDTGEAEALPAHWSRTATERWRKTEAKVAVRQAIAGLSPQDRELLALRITAGLSWRTVAEVLHPDDDPARKSAALRKRFERVKERLKEAVGR